MAIRINTTIKQILILTDNNIKDINNILQQYDFETIKGTSNDGKTCIMFRKFNTSLIMRFNIGMTMVLFKDNTYSFVDTDTVKKLIVY